MQKSFFTLPEALKIMQLRDKEGKPFPFDLTYRTFNSQTKQGGRLKIYDKATHIPDANPNAIVKDTIFNILDPIKSVRKPSHFDNRTRNIELQNGEVKKIRIDFIISINHINVIY